VEDSQATKESSQIYRISWLGYIRPVIKFLVILVLCALFILNLDAIAAMINFPALISSPFAIAVPAVIALLASISFVLRIYYLRTLKFIINHDGVYLFRGIFPWTKGTTGTLWQDIADAQYFPGFIAWLTKTYSVQVRFRFNKSNETFVPYIWNGHRAVMAINKELQERAR